MHKQYLNALQRLTVSCLALTLVGAGIPQPVQSVVSQRLPQPGLPRVGVLTSPNIVPAAAALPDIPARPRPVRRTVWVTVTAYSSTVDQTDSDPFTTASGEKVRPGIVAWNAAPFGAELRLPDVFGEKIFVVQDRLNERATPYHLDIWMPTREQALAWGARVLKVEVLQTS